MARTKTPADAPEHTDASETPDAPETPGAPETPDAAAQNGQGEQDKPKRKPAPDTSILSAEDIRGAVLADFPALVEAGKPMRERSDEQKEMDRIAARAYEKWVEAGRPTLWASMPVVTYFASDAKAAEAYVYLIKRAVQVVEPQGESTGVRAHFGNQFTLSEQMAEKVSKPEEAGKIVIMWAAIDKRKTAEEDKRRKDVVTANQEARADGTAPEKPEE